MNRAIDGLSIGFERRPDSAGVGTVPAGSMGTCGGCPGF